MPNKPGDAGDPLSTLELIFSSAASASDYSLFTMNSKALCETFFEELADKHGIDHGQLIDDFWEFCLHISQLAFEGHMNSAAIAPIRHFCEYAAVFNVNNTISELPLTKIIKKFESYSIQIYGSSDPYERWFLEFAMPRGYEMLVSTIPADNSGFADLQNQAGAALINLLRYRDFGAYIKLIHIFPKFGFSLHGLEGKGISRLMDSYLTYLIGAINEGVLSLREGNQTKTLPVRVIHEKVIERTLIASIVLRGRALHENMFPGINALARSAAPLASMETGPSLRMIYTNFIADTFVDLTLAPGSQSPREFFAEQLFETLASSLRELLSDSGIKSIAIPNAVAPVVLNPDEAPILSKPLRSVIESGNDRAWSYIEKLFLEINQRIPKVVDPQFTNVYFHYLTAATVAAHGSPYWDKMRKILDDFRVGRRISQYFLLDFAKELFDVYFGQISREDFEALVRQLR